MKAFDHDVAISALGYDSLLVNELMARLRPRLERSAIWSGQDAFGAPATPPIDPVLGRSTRVVLVLLHRLWAEAAAMAVESDALRQRMKKQPGSVVVLVLDGALVPDWLESAVRHDLAAEGLDPLIDSLLTLVAGKGGPVRPAEAMMPEVIERMYDTPKPFLDQARAQSTLKRELDQMLDKARNRLGVPAKAKADDTVGVISLPNRFIARHETTAVSFSWIAGRAGAIPEGRLMVIEWEGVSSRQDGSSLKDARACREVVYHVEGADPESWCWRVEQPHGRACSTSNLVAQWIDGVARVAPAVATA